MANGLLVLTDPLPREPIALDDALANGIDEVKNAATQVTAWPNVDHGVARTLQQLFS